MIRLQINPANNWLNSNGFTKIEEKDLYVKQLQDVYDNPRYYLDNFEYMVEYRLSNGNYSKKGAKIHHFPIHL